MSFRDMVAADNQGVFLNLDEFAEKRDIRYDGQVFYDVPVVLAGVRQQPLATFRDNYTQGVFAASTVLRCLASDVGGITPQQGSRLEISDPARNRADIDRPERAYFCRYIVAASVCEFGMLRVELEMRDE